MNFYLESHRLSILCCFRLLLPSFVSTAQCIAMTMTRAVIARRIIFLILFFIFLREVILSSLKWHRGDIGTLNEKDGADHVTYPSLSLCLVPMPNQIEEITNSKNETWNFPNSTRDRLIEVRQKILVDDG